MSKTGLKKLDIYTNNWPRLSKKFHKLDKALNKLWAMYPVDTSIFLKIKAIEAQEKWENRNTLEETDEKDGRNFSAGG